ncbi:MAG: type II toxin-antitoxin system RelE/ParE family toxin [Bacteroidetes bacterium]|nr:type II toxin-antitoxin system RelE/ParE family toxin [Fibrella sp.]
MAEEKIDWSENTQADFNGIIEYLADVWSPQMAERFIDEFYKKLDLLEANPEIGRRSERRPDIRVFPITKYNRLYYTLQKDRIVLINLLDTRSNPDENPY